MKMSHAFQAFAFTVMAVQLAACDSATDPSDQFLRVRNVGSAPIGALRVSFPGGSTEFGDIPVGAITDYHGSAGVYRYASFRYTVDGKVHIQLVDDFVGAVPERGARFTYNVELIKLSNDSLWLDLRSLTRDK